VRFFIQVFSIFFILFFIFSSAAGENLTSQNLKVSAPKYHYDFVSSSSFIQVQSWTAFSDQKNKKQDFILSAHPELIMGNAAQDQDCRGKTPGGVCLEQVSNFYLSWPVALINQNIQQVKALGYQIDLGTGLISPGEVDITAASPAGLFLGAQTLMKLLDQNPRLPRGLIQDWPSQK